MSRRDLIEDGWREHRPGAWLVDLTGESDSAWTARFSPIRDYVLMRRGREGQPHVQIVFDKDTISVIGVRPRDEDRLKLEVSEIVAATNGDD
jgi:hypothetical protein